MPPVEAASSTTVVGATVPNATSVDVTGCPPVAAGVTHFGMLQAGDAAVTTADCVVSFGSSNGTGSLRIQQEDGAGNAMFQASKGALDPSFAPRTDHPYSVDSRGRGGLVQRDGKVVTIGYSENANEFLVARFLQDGNPDLSFDGDAGNADGLVSEYHSRGGEDHAEAVVEQPDGKLVIAGANTQAGESYDPAIMRLMPDGTTDPTFDGDTTMPGYPGNGEVRHLITTSMDYVVDVALQDDGKIIVAGYTSSAGFDYFVLRLHEDGRRDTSFGSGGVAMGDVGGLRTLTRAVAVQDDGSIVLTGSLGSSPTYDMFVVRLLPDGSPDPAFDGPATSPGYPGNGEVRFVLSADNDYANAVDLDRDGTILVGGQLTVGAASDHMLVRLDATGALDPTFVGDTGTGAGIVTLPAPAGESSNLYDMYLTGDGRIVTTGYWWTGARADLLVTRWESDGRADTSFEDDGNVRYVVNEYDYGYAVSPAVDGRIAVSGSTWINGGTNERLLTVVLDSGGVVEDFVDGVNDWDDGTRAFGACLSSVTDATAAWTASAGCPDTDGAHWQAVPAAASTVASTTVATTTTAQAAFRFGFRTSSDQVAGRYLAPIRFEVVAPAT